MSKLLFVGECMLELRRDKSGQLHSNYAGDTYNSAVYAKRLCPFFDVAYLSAIGQDLFSQQLLETMDAEGIETGLISRDNTRNLGIYSIVTDDSGERSFAYWRDNSAATKMLKQFDENSINEGEISLVFFSGITLAILDEQDRIKLLNLLQSLKSKGEDKGKYKGAIIVFDPNYRARLWRDKNEAKYWLEQAYALADIALPGLEDHQTLYQHQNAEEVHQFLNQFGVNEQVIKCGTQGTDIFNTQSRLCHQVFEPAAIQEDTTGAGDSFAGAYLSSRLNGDSVADAVKHASKFAAIVVQHPGAVISPTLSRPFVQTARA